MIKLNELHAISLAASTDKNRYYLNGVRIENYKDGKHGIIATNGHIIAMLHLQPHEIVNSFTIPNDDIEILLFVARKYYAASAKIDFENRKIELFNAEKSFFVMEFKPIDLAYPDFRKIIEDAPEEATPSIAVQFDAKYLAVFGEIHEILRGSKTITILPLSPSEQAIITFYDCPEFSGRVMPMWS